MAAEKRGEFTREDILAAGCWFTCACGRQDAEIPRRPGGMPEDIQLIKNGARFSDAVYLRRFQEAAHCLIAIETRAAEILAGMK